MRPAAGAGFIGRAGMLSDDREALYVQGRQFQQQGESEAALKCFLTCLQGLTHVHSFQSLPDCLHQIAEVFNHEKKYVKALRFIQAEKMFYEVALADLAALQGSSVCLTAPPEVMQQGTEGWLSEEDVSEQACQAGDYEKLAQVCIMSKRPHLALEYSGKATKIRQKAFGNDHPITARSLELLASVYAEIGKTEYSDTIGQYTSVLSKTFSPADSFSEVLNGVPLAKTEVCPDRRRLHKKDLLLSPTHSKEKVTTCKCLTSILRKRSSFSCSENEFTHRKKSDRRVRFREPEVIVHDIPYYDCLLAYDQSTNQTHFALLACIFVLLSVLGVILYCTDKRRCLKVCEELESMLIVSFLQMKQILWSCWMWLTRQ